MPPLPRGRTTRYAPPSSSCPGCRRASRRRSAASGTKHNIERRAGSAGRSWDREHSKSNPHYHGVTSTEFGVSESLSRWLVALASARPAPLPRPPPHRQRPALAAGRRPAGPGTGLRRQQSSSRREAHRANSTTGPSSPQSASAARPAAPTARSARRTRLRKVRVQSNSPAAPPGPPGDQRPASRPRSAGRTSSDQVQLDRRPGSAMRAPRAGWQATSAWCSRRKGKPRGVDRDRHRHVTAGQAADLRRRRSAARAPTRSRSPGHSPASRCAASSGATAGLPRATRPKSRLSGSTARRGACQPGIQAAQERLQRSVGVRSPAAPTWPWPPGRGGCAPGTSGQNRRQPGAGEPRPSAGRRGPPAPRWCGPPPRCERRTAARPPRG